MSRSYRKTPVVSRTGGPPSEKEDKRRNHSVLRMHFRTSLRAAEDLEAFQFSDRNVAHSNARGFGRANKRYEHIRVRLDRRSLHRLVAPPWVSSERELHQALGK